MGRSRPRGRRAVADRSSTEPPSLQSAVEPARAPSLASSTLPRVWQDVGYRPLSDPSPARALFDFVAAPWPAEVGLAWGAWRAGSAGDGERLVGAVLGEHSGRALMLHGPIVVADQDALEVAAQLVAAVLDHARALDVETVYSRPQGLDRVWIRFGFIPVPEGALPQSLRGRPGVGLFAWRGGSALWTFRESAAPGAERAAAGTERAAPFDG